MFTNESPVCVIKIPRQTGEKVLDAIFCPAVKHFGVLLKDRPASIYDLLTHELVAQPEMHPAIGLAFRARRPESDEHEVALACGTDSTDIVRYDYMRKEKLESLFMPRAQSVAYSPGGHLLAAGSTDGVVRIWTLKGKSTEAVCVKIAGSAVTRLSFGFLGRLLFAATASGDLYVVNAHGKFSAIRIGDPENPDARWECHAVAGHPMAKVTAFAGSGNEVHVYYDGLKNVISFDTYQENRFIRQLQFQHSDSRLIAVGDRGIEVWNLSSSYELMTQWVPQSGRVLSAAFSEQVIFAAVD